MANGEKSVSDHEARLVHKWLSAEIKEGAGDDDKARRILARFLRSSLPLDLGLRVLLANQIDPDTRDDAGQWLAFKRVRGNRSRRVNSRQIAAAVWDRNVKGEKWEAAVQQAMKDFGVGRSTVTAAWDKWSPVFASPLRSKMKMLTRLSP